MDGNFSSVILRPACACLSLAVAHLSGCAKDPPRPLDPPPPTTPAHAPLQLGEPISPGTTALSLSDLAARAADYRGKTIATTGVVTAVCQEMGCWMEIKDDKGAAHIRMHGHSFFVPKTASGHHARVQATLVAADDKTECDEEGGDAGKALTKVELDATGIELD
jgi:hypothetical protein